MKILRLDGWREGWGEWRETISSGTCYWAHAVTFQEEGNDLTQAESGSRAFIRRDVRFIRRNAEGVAMRAAQG